LFSVLLMSGLLAALPTQALFWVALHRFDWIRLAALVGVIAEATWIVAAQPRPWSVNRQVSQSWGHEHGPWKAALRYGFRLGVGPATILNSWSWWVGAVVSTLSLRHGAAFVISFVALRSALTVLLPGNPSNGLVLSQRMAKFRLVEPRGRYIGLALTLGASGLWLMT
jgi:hypothetical protein